MTGMNRAQRRSLKATVKRMVKSGPGLAHPVPDSVVLHGGPMDGWIVKPDAPALQPDWRAKYIDEAARTASEESRRMVSLQFDVPDAMVPSWEELTEGQRETLRAVKRDIHGAGHYELRGKGQAEWVVG